MLISYLLAQLETHEMQDARDYAPNSLHFLLIQPKGEHGICNCFVIHLVHRAGFVIVSPTIDVIVNTGVSYKAVSIKFLFTAPIQQLEKTVQLPVFWWVTLRYHLEVWNENQWLINSIMLDKIHYLIEAMEVSFPGLLVNDSRFFEQVISDISTNRISLKVEIYIHVFSKSRWIVIPLGLCIAESFQDGIWLDQDILNPETLQMIHLQCNVTRNIFPPLKITEVFVIILAFGFTFQFLAALPNSLQLRCISL